MLVRCITCNLTGRFREVIAEDSTRGEEPQRVPAKRHRDDIGPSQRDRSECAPSRTVVGIALYYFVGSTIETDW